MPAFLDHPFIRKHGAKFLRFALVGATGAVVDLGGLHLLITQAGVSKYIAPIFSTLLSVTVVFLLNKFFTFKSSGKAGGEAFRFAFVYGVAILSNIIITTSLIWAGVHPLISKCIAIGIGMLWNYGMSHAFVFKKKDRELLESAAVV